MVSAESLWGTVITNDIKAVLVYLRPSNGYVAYYPWGGGGGGIPYLKVRVNQIWANKPFPGLKILQVGHPKPRQHL